MSESVEPLLVQVSRRLIVGDIKVTHDADGGFRLELLDAGGRLVEPADALALAEWLRTNALDDIQNRRTLQWREERRVKREEKLAERAAELDGTVHRYWYAFHTNVREPAKAFPHPLWLRQEGSKFVISALIDTPRIAAQVVLEHWPEARELWCVRKPDDWTPPEDRFPPQEAVRGA